MVMSALSARRAAATMSSDGFSAGSIIAAASLSASALSASALSVSALSASALSVSGRSHSALSGSPGSWSAAGEAGLPRAILQETLHSGPRVLGAEQPGEVQPLDLQAGVKVSLQAAVNRVLRRPQRDRRAAGVPSGQFKRRLIHLIVRDDLVGEADQECFGR